ncbi:hypothetical protein DENSPDRAFT_220526 [Dentipellis sp. KUC8613]|nr:hypothetical protein DENSPDRAFT_220526 [Dentipellis sp. KUC8613]
MYSQPAAQAHHHHTQWRPPPAAYASAPASAPMMPSFPAIWRPDPASQPKPVPSQPQVQQQPPQSAPASGGSSSYVYVGAGNGYPAPPPVPQGVNPQTWMQGRWRYQHPAPSATYGPALPPPSAVGWNVHSGWGVPAAQTYYPPQRRPDPSYWQTELSNNGLGLENMHIRQEPKKEGGSGGKAPHTPWTWVPRELTAEDSPPSQTQTQTRQPNDERRYTADSASRNTQSHSYSQSQSQSQSGPPAPYYPGMSSQQRPTQTSSASAQARQTSSGSTQPSGSSAGRPVQRAHTMPADLLAPTPQRAQHGQTSSGQPQPESFSEVKALRTTFSPAIIRTPTHYRNASRSGIYQDSAASGGAMSASSNVNGGASASTNSFSSAASSTSSSSTSSAATVRPAARAQTAPSQSTPVPSAESHHPRSLGRHATAPAISTSGVYRDRERERDRDGPLNNSISSLSHFAEEPEGMLSPLLEVSPIPDTGDRETRAQTTTGQPEGRYNPYGSRQSSQQPQPQVQVQTQTSQAQSHRRAPSRSPTYPFQQQPYPQTQPASQHASQGFYADTSPREQPRSNRSSLGATGGASASASASPHSYTTHSTPSSTRTRSSGAGSLQPSPHHSTHYGSAGEQGLGMVPYGGVSPMHAQGASQAQAYAQRDRERERERDRGSDRERDRDRDRDWDRHQRHHRERERERERDRDREPSSRHTHSRAASRSHHTSATSTPASTTSSSSSSSSMNPLPIPPRDVYTSPDAALARVLPPPQPRTPPPGTYRHRVRWGFWNRRGDYLTPDLRVVYAPPERANPTELSRYPSAMEGYMDHNGRRMPYDAMRPEVEESRPSKGRAPLAPYDRFVTYVYM